ncbi:excinuclease ABC subunit A, partial [Brachybacterium alimentarium]
MGTFVGARRYVLDTFANTKSVSMKRRVAQFLTVAPCPACHGKRLKPEALSVTFEGLDVADLSSLPLAELSTLIEEAVERATGDLDGTETAGQALDNAARRDAVQQRVDAGGSAHAAAPDVRKTPNHSVEKL